MWGHGALLSEGGIGWGWCGRLEEEGGGLGELLLGLLVVFDGPRFYAGFPRVGTVVDDVVEGLVIEGDFAALGEGDGEVEVAGARGEVGEWGWRLEGVLFFGAGAVSLGPSVARQEFDEVFVDDWRGGFIEVDAYPGAGAVVEIVVEVGCPDAGDTAGAGMFHDDILVTVGVVFLADPAYAIGVGKPAGGVLFGLVVGDGLAIIATGLELLVWGVGKARE